jgi:hypothetical protein
MVKCEDIIKVTSRFMVRGIGSRFVSGMSPQQKEMKGK